MLDGGNGILQLIFLQKTGYNIYKAQKSPKQNYTQFQYHPTTHMVGSGIGILQLILLQKTGYNIYKAQKSQNQNLII